MHHKTRLVDCFLPLTVLVTLFSAGASHALELGPREDLILGTSQDGAVTKRNADGDLIFQVMSPVPDDGANGTQEPSGDEDMDKLLIIPAPVRPGHPDPGSPSSGHSPQVIPKKGKEY